MKYVSCRDEANDLSNRRTYTFRESIFAGWAEDGGMLMPETFPALNISDVAKWRNDKISYPECCYQILRLFIPVQDISNEALHKLITVDAFSNFGHSEIVVNHVLESQPGTNVLELWHGNTLAFKDLGMQCLCKLLQHYLENDKDAPNLLNLLVGTSGDTGSSAIEAVKDLSNVSITVLYPKGRGITELQELQMTVVGEEEGNGVKVIGIDGTSDDLDRPMEAVFGDVAFRKTHSIGSVNSVNICRVVVQIAHYIWATVVVAPNTEQDIHFYVPTGAGGHVTAGCMAKRMLCDVSQNIFLHIATNSNDVFHQIISTGDSKSSSTSSLLDMSCCTSSRTSSSLPPMVSTIAPSMDIQIPYNLERLLWMSAMFSTNNNEEKIARCIESARLMREFKKTERIILTEEIRLRLFQYCGVIESSSHNDEDTLEVIRQIYLSEADNYVLDPHTAIGVRASMLDQQRKEGSIVFCMACAHPSKFSEAIGNALKNEKNEKNEKKKEDKWWWLSTTDLNHSSVQRLLELDRSNREPVSEEYKLGTDWTKRLKEHFVLQTERLKENKK